MSHFDEMTGLLYLEGQLEAEQEREVSAHLSSCAACRSLLQALQKENIWLKAGFARRRGIAACAIDARLRASGGATSVGLGIRLWESRRRGFTRSGAGLIDPWLTQASDAGFNQGNVLTMLFFSGAFWKGWDADAKHDRISFDGRGWNRGCCGCCGGVGGDSRWRLRWWQPGLRVLTLSPTASAAEVNHGDPNYTLPAGQEVKTDLIVAAEHTRIDGDVDGDLIVFSRSITVNGHVKGDILAFGQEVHINGPVDGNVRAFAQALS